MSATNALRDPLGRVGRSFGTAGPDTGSRGLGTGRGSTGARYSASVLGNDTKNLGNKNILNILFKRLLKMKNEKKREKRNKQLEIEKQMQNMLQLEFLICF